MRKIHLVFAIIIFACTHIKGQITTDDLGHKMPQESIYMHLNTTLLFCGEQLLYQAYCLDNATKKLSELSTVVHLYLVNRENQQVYSQKLSLTDGTGQGDFFIPATLPTGSYKLYALTEWMKNGTPEHFFQADLQIINPYTPVPSQYLQKASITDSLTSAESSRDLQNNLPANPDVIDTPFNTPKDSTSGEQRKLVKLSFRSIKETEQMKQGPSKYNFQADQKIINPYQADTSNDITIIPESTRQITLDHERNSNTTSTDAKGPVKISLDNINPGKREVITFTISGLDKTEIEGNYSLSVRKCAPINTPENSIASFYRDFLNRPVLRPNGIKTEALPELRGSLLSGTLITKTGNTPVTGQKIALSILGQDSFFQISTTDSQGRFNFNIDWSYGNSPGYFQLLGSDWENIDMQLDAEDIPFGNPSFPEFTISEDLSDFIRQKSIQIQVERSYAEVKRDSVFPARYPWALNKDLPYAYHLDDYTRFNSIEETMVEIINHVYIKTESGHRVFQVRPEDVVPDAPLLPLVFVDGLFIKDHESIMDFSAKKIRSVHFSRDKYLVGSVYFQGVLAFETFEGNFANGYFSSEVQEEALTGPEPEKAYYYQAYDDSRSQVVKRVPDFRHQLLWIPELTLRSQLSFECFTSDLSGTYEVVLKGFTAAGAPVEVREYFEVK